MTVFDIPAVPALDDAALESREAVSLAFSSTPEYAAAEQLQVPAVWLAGCQVAVPPRPVERVRAIAFISHNGIGQRGVSAFAPEATAEMAERISAGVGPVCTLARAAGVSLSVVDPGASSGAIDVEDGLALEHVQQALRAGADIADREVDAGTDLLLPLGIGVGNTTVAAAIMGRLTGTEPVKIVGPGSGITDAGWKTKVAVIRDAMFRARQLSEPVELLAALGSPSLAATVGFILQAAARRTPIIIDDAWTATAAALAYRLAPELPTWILAVGSCPEPAFRAALEDMSLTAFPQPHTRGGGLAALSALPAIHTSVELAQDACAQFSAEGAEGPEEAE